MSEDVFRNYIAEQPDAVARMIADAERVPRLDPTRPLVLTGIGSSLHAAQVAASWVETLTQGRVRGTVRDAHDLAVSGALRPEDQVVVVSHRGTKRQPGEVLRRAAQVGATAVAVTGVGARPSADVVLHTVPQERASTHTVSYTAALAVLAQLVAGYVGTDGAALLDALAEAPDSMRDTLDLPLDERVVDALAADGAAPGIIAGTGLDAITAAEAALKVKEGTYLWLEGMHTEFALHGTPAVFRPGMVACLIEPAGPDAGRTRDLEGFLRRLGGRVLHCRPDETADLPHAPCHPLVRPLVVILAFHRLVAEVSQQVASSPVSTHLDAEPWKSAFDGIAL